MSLKLKALGFGLLAALSVSAVAVMNASATGVGHGVTEGITHATIEGTDKLTTTHFTEFTLHGLEGGIVCDKISYHGTTTKETEEDLTITPSYQECFTTGNTNSQFGVHVNGCTYTFTITKGTTDATEQKVHIVCPPGKAIEITHPNCTIKVPPQTIETGITYTTLFENGKHTITLDLTKPGVTVTSHFEAGLCVFTGTSHVGTLHGSVTVEARDTLGNLVNLTVT